MGQQLTALPLAVLVGASPAPANNAACAKTPVKLLSSHEIHAGVPPELGLLWPEKPTVIRVIVGANGNVVRATIVRSSGVRGTDNIAARMAMRSDYSPARQHCRAVIGTYIYVEDWQDDVK